MELLISHKETKREIKGPFSIGITRENLMKLLAQLEVGDDFSFGWIDINEVKVQKILTNTPPIPWDDK